MLQLIFARVSFVAQRCLLLAFVSCIFEALQNKSQETKSERREQKREKSVLVCLRSAFKSEFVSVFIIFSFAIHKAAQKQMFANLSLTKQFCFVFVLLLVLLFAWKKARFFLHALILCNSQLQQTKLKQIFSGFFVFVACFPCNDATSNETVLPFSQQIGEFLMLFASGSSSLRLFAPWTIAVWLPQVCFFFVSAFVGQIQFARRAKQTNRRKVRCF